MLSDKQSVRDLVELCHQFGIKQVVISPGSRNAPLTISFTEHGHFECFSIIDERSAAFFAMGLSQSSNIPTVLVCTSGSALLNYSPAIVESYYQHIPLLILSADRPQKWIDQGEGQSMRQFEVYKNFIQKSISLNENNNTDTSKNNCIAINLALDRLIEPTPGPVHINIPLDEPLYNIKEYITAPPKLQLIEKSSLGIPETKKQYLIEKWKNSKKILILTGMLKPNPALNKILETISSRNKHIVILTETTSNLYSNLFINNIDRNLSLIETKSDGDYIPEILITLGHNLISKKVKYWLRESKLVEHWHIDEWGDFQDTFDQLTESLQISPTIIFQEFNKISASTSSDYRGLWQKLTIQSNEAHNHFFKHCKWSDLKVFEIIVSKLPDNIKLQLANSTVVRYMQLFKMNNSWTQHSNRGVSGIDGCTSTALGYSWNEEGLTFLITGDISFGYDSNAFWHHYLKKNQRIIVISNGGGGIFRFIEGPSSTNQLEEFFETPREGHVKAISDRYQLPYFKATDEKSLMEILPKFLAINEVEKPMILEINTPRLINDTVLKQYFKNMKQKTTNPD